MPAGLWKECEEEPMRNGAQESTVKRSSNDVWNHGGVVSSGNESEAPTANALLGYL